MALTDTVVQKARPRNKDYILNDTDGLVLFVPMKGKKKWHFRFCFGNSRPRMSFGVYPEISLKDARQLRDEMRALVAKGIEALNSIRSRFATSPMHPISCAA